MTEPNENARPNGASAAAIVAACLGCFVLGVLAAVGDASKAVAKMLTFFTPTGPLSGVSTMAIVVWLAVWWVGHRMWKGTQISLAKVNAVAFTLLALGLLLTFPPFEDLVIGK